MWREDEGPPALPHIAERDARTFAFIFGRPLSSGDHVRDVLVQAIASGAVTRGHACDGKAKFRTPGYAQRVAAAMSAQYGKPQYVYPCPFCSCYHLATDKHR